MRWRNNDLDRPARSGEYLVLSRNKAFHILKYDTSTGLWNANINRDKAIKIEAWTFLPSMEEIMMDLQEG